MLINLYIFSATPIIDVYGEAIENINTAINEIYHKECTGIIPIIETSLVLLEYRSSAIIIKTAANKIPIKINLLISILILLKLHKILL